MSEAAENFLRRNGFHIVAMPQERASSQQNINNTKYKALLNNVINNTPKQTQQRVENAILTQTAPYMEKLKDHQITLAINQFNKSQVICENNPEECKIEKKKK